MARTKIKSYENVEEEEEVNVMHNESANTDWGVVNVSKDVQRSLTFDTFSYLRNLFKFIGKS